jgi:hypothetical protein
MLRTTKFSVPAILALLIIAAPVFASTVTYTTLASFTAATTGVTDQNFDSSSTGMLTPGDGTTVGTVGTLSFTANVAGGYGFDITNVFVTTSGSNYLGAGNSAVTLGNLASQDNFTVMLPSSSAIGLYLLVAGPLNAGDFTLSVAGGSAVNSAAFTDFSGTYVYFLGLTSDSAFTSATLAVTTPGGPADGPYWNVDDIRYGTANTTAPPTVPEPASLLLIGTGLVGVVRRFRKA